MTATSASLSRAAVLVFSGSEVIWLVSATAVGAWFGARRRRVDPELRVVDVAAAVLVDDVEVAVVVHRHALVRSARGRRAGCRRRETIVSELLTLPARSTLTILPDSWLMISRWSLSAARSGSARFDEREDVGEVEQCRRSAGSKRLVEFVGGRRAVGRGARVPVDAGLEDALGSVSLTTMKPPVIGSLVTPSRPMLPIVVPSLTVLASPRVQRRRRRRR